MSSLYIVESTDGEVRFTVEPGTINGPSAATQSTDLKFVGSGLYGWGQAYVNNFFRLLENFAIEEKIVSGKPVPKDATDFTANPSQCYGLNKGVNAPVVGQTWYNKTREELFVYTGTEWVPASSFQVSSTDPSISVPGYTPAVGQLWYDTSGDPYVSPVNNVTAAGVLKIFDGTSFVDVALPVTDKLYPITGGTLYGGLSTGGETSPDVDAGGICVNTNAGNSLALSLKNNSVNHNFTSLFQADTYGFVSKVSSTAGGVLVGGLSEAGTGVQISSYATTPNTSVVSPGVVHVAAFKNNGTGTTTLANNENMLSVANDSGVKLLVKGNGDTSVTGTFSAAGSITSSDSISATNNITAGATVSGITGSFTGHVSANTLTVTGLASSNVSVASITNNNHLTTKQYVDNIVSNSLYEPVSGNWHNNGWLRVHPDGGTEVGSYLDLHAFNNGTTNYDAKLSVIDLGGSYGQHILLQGPDWLTSSLSLRAQTGDVILRSQVGYNSASTTYPHIQLYDNSLESDAAYPEGLIFDPKKYAEFGREHNTKGGLRVRGYLKNGLNVNSPALRLEGIKDDNGQLLGQYGVVTINAARYVADTLQIVDANDNLLVMCNNNVPVVTVKGDGRVYSAAPITDDDQLASKSYADGVLWDDGIYGFHISPGGLITQWGRIAVTPGGAQWATGTHTLPTTFPNRCTSIVGTCGTQYNGATIWTAGGAQDVVIFADTTTTSFRWRLDTNDGYSMTGVHYIRWIAIGF